MFIKIFSSRGIGKSNPEVGEREVVEAMEEDFLLVGATRMLLTRGTSGKNSRKSVLEHKPEDSA